MNKRQRKKRLKALINFLFEKPYNQGGNLIYRVKEKHFKKQKEVSEDEYQNLMDYVGTLKIRMMGDLYNNQ